MGAGGYLDLSRGVKIYNNMLTNGTLTTGNENPQVNAKVATMKTSM